MTGESSSNRRGTVTRFSAGDQLTSPATSADQLYNAAEDARLRQRYRDAIQLYEQVIQTAPGTQAAASAQLRIGDIAFDNLKDKQLARKAYQACLAANLRTFFDATTIQVIEGRLANLEAQESK